MAAVVADVAATAALNGRTGACYALSIGLYRLPRRLRRVALRIGQRTIESSVVQSLRDRTTDHTAQMIAYWLTDAASAAHADDSCPLREKLAIGLLATGWLYSCKRDWDAMAILRGLEELARSESRDDQLAFRLRLRIQGGLAWGQGAAGLAVAREVLAQRTKAFGSYDVDTYAAMSLVARATALAGDPSGACEQYEHLHRAAIGRFGPNHAQVLTTGADLAELTGQVQGPADAIAMLPEFIEMSEAILGPQHPSTLMIRARLAHWIGVNGQRREACEDLRCILALQTAVLGESHPQTVATREDLMAFGCE